MPKAKTDKTTAKRFKITGTGKLLKLHVNTGHLKIKQSSRTKRRKGHEELIAKGNLKRVNRLLNR
ncbi:hypothetical protein A3A70_02030 [candidate division WWE3 bacterium RIFCSPLOWO2_01_FULL_42_11]|uniref:Large ribosomal subunit protein bL35 n=1 Tax=candidate division WWE3 bacterium RIFCSPLOWO2_01_FULL_42_11 TaxID=1802627 RepID=A0A1F4VRA3_UNCKA|nr:MAG: hypothetical protein A3A70_02030 [candidate division WWE3 bacterium RIFCSPLOWO2_01_FULL_42_11]